MRQQLRDGRETLRSLTGQDFGFDLQAWHDYLKESKDGARCGVHECSFFRVKRDAS